jgi:DNA-binding XRE family transcriptional regulator
MAKKWPDLYGGIPAERRARIEAKVAQDMAEMPLAEMRRARELTQQQIARNLEVNQAWVSKVERQIDMYVSTLRSYVEAMGGELDIIARFHDGAVRVRQFEDLEQGAAEWRQSESTVPSIGKESTIPHVKVWSPHPTPSALQEGQPRARVWDNAESSTPGLTPSRHTPARRITSRAA